MEPRTIIADRSLLERAVEYFVEGKNMPDISDKPTIPAEEMCLWLKQKRKSRLRPHSTLKGVCGTWMNAAYDFGLENNNWPVVFKDLNGETCDLVSEATVVVWIKYVSFMVCIHTFWHVYKHTVYKHADTYTNTLYTNILTRIQTFWHVHEHTICRKVTFFWDQTRLKKF